MLLAIDIGNTNIVIGCMEGNQAVLSFRLATDRNATELEYALQIRKGLIILFPKRSSGFLPVCKHTGRPRDIVFASDFESDPPFFSNHSLSATGSVVNSPSGKNPVNTKSHRHG